MHNLTLVRKDNVAALWRTGFCGAKVERGRQFEVNVTTLKRKVAQFKAAALEVVVSGQILEIIYSRGDNIS